MLSLIGLGLWDDEDVSLKGLNIAKNADTVYIELYTSKWYGNIRKMENIIGKKIKVLKREDLEEKSDKIIDEARKKSVVVFVPGDPLVATTHTSLLIDAKKNGVKTEIIHNASIYSAIGECSLHLYKFGATATVPFPEKTETPLSTYETIKENKERGLHTLILLDIISEKNEYMTPNEGMKILLQAEERERKKIFTEDTEIVVLARIGSKESLIAYGKIKELLKKDFGEPPFVIIVPGKLHFTEKEYLDFYHVSK